jgi:hypothetical protein
MFDFLLETRKFTKEQNGQLTLEQKEPWMQQYRKIIAEGWGTNPLPPEPVKKKRGRRKKTKSQNMLDRLGLPITHKEGWTIRFMPCTVAVWKLKTKSNGRFLVPRPLPVFAG